MQPEAKGAERVFRFTDICPAVEKKEQDYE